MLAHCLGLVDAAGPACVAVKPQLACFERFGFPGWLALEATVAHARERGLLVIADAKRGDFPGSARAYAQAMFGGIATPYGESPGLGADAITQNPLLGRDALAPFVDGARAAGAGVFVLVRTSNPGAADLFDAELAAGGPLWEQIAGLVDAAGTPGPESGLAEVGAVTGATAPQHLARMRELMPNAPFLLPGDRRPGRLGGGPRARVRSRPRRGPGQRLALDRQRARSLGSRRRRGGARRGGAAARAGLGARLSAPRRTAGRPGPPRRRLRGSAGSPGYHRTRWPDAAPRAFSRRSRWWSSRWPCSWSSRAQRRTRWRDRRAGHRRAGGGDAVAERQEEAATAQDVHRSSPATRPRASP